MSVIIIIVHSCVLYALQHVGRCCWLMACEIELNIVLHVCWLGLVNGVKLLRRQSIATIDVCINYQG